MFWTMILHIVLLIVIFIVCTWFGYQAGYEKCQQDIDLKFKELLDTFDRTLWEVKDEEEVGLEEED